MKGKKEPITSGAQITGSAYTLESREDQMIALAVNLAEKQLAEGTASSQVITHYLKLGSTKEKLEKQMMAQQIELIAAKKEALQSAKHIEELYAKAMEAFQGYAGHGNDSEDVY